MSNNPLEGMTAEQILAVKCPHPMTAVLAAAGSGKTKVLVERCLAFHAIAKVDPSKIAVITYTTAAAKEIEQRIAKVAPGIRLGYIGTIHGFGLKLLRLHGTSIGLHGGLAVADEKTANIILLQCVEEMSMKCSFSAARNIVAGEHGDKPKERELFKLYHATMAKNGLVDFTGILLHTRSLIAARDGETFVEALLVDEYQDVAAPDHWIVSSLKTKFKFVVGDPRQAIFGFRGGDPRHLALFCTSPLWMANKLTLNFRSAPEIVRAANRLALHFKEPYDQMRPTSEEEGDVSPYHSFNPGIQSARIVEKLRALSGSRVVLCRYNRHLDEIHRILKANGIPAVAKQLREKPPGWDIARALVAFLSNPGSPALAFTLASLTQGVKRAEALEKESKETGVSMRRLIQMDQDREFTEIWAILEQAKIPAETVALIWNIVNSLPANEQTWTGLGAALASPDVLEAGDTSTGNEVVLSTIHSFKGREADHVLIAYANDEFIPGQSKDPHRIEEERRLFYVAVTRARKTLSIYTTAQSVGFRGADTLMETRPSRFVEEAFGS